MRAAVIAIVVGAVVAGPATATAQSPQVLRFHGGAYDRAAAIVADGSGNSYVGGSVESREGASSFAVVNFGPDGAARWTARYDGSRGGVGRPGQCRGRGRRGQRVRRGIHWRRRDVQHELRLPRREVRRGRDAALGAAL